MASKLKNGSKRILPSSDGIRRMGRDHSGQRVRKFQSSSKGTQFTEGNNEPVNNGVLLPAHLCFQLMPGLFKH